MKITYSILALLATGFLGQSAFAEDNNCQNTGLNLAVTQTGHGQSHFMYFQTAGLAYPNIVAPASIAITTDSGGVDYSTAAVSPSNAPGGVKFVIGTNQHGQTMAAFVPVASNFGPARQ